MKKLILLCFLIVSISASAESKMDSCIRVSREKEKLMSDSINNSKYAIVDTIKANMDTTFQLGKQFIDISSKHIKKFGLKDYLQRNVKIFLPLIVFLILYLLWLRGRK